MADRIRAKSVLALLIAVVALVLMPALPAAAGSGQYQDARNDVTYYDWDTDQSFRGQWDELDIHTIAISAGASSVQVTTRVVKLTPGWWKIVQHAYDVNGDSREDYRLNIFPQGAASFRRVNGVQDLGTEVPCAGIQTNIDYPNSQVVSNVPRSCLGNTASVGVSTATFDSEDYSCDCNDTVLDVWPNQIGTYSPMIPYTTASTAPPTSGSYDANGPMGTIYRLYRAYFLREPDRGGYDYWLGVYRNGYPLTDISQNFSRSTEFQRTYGTLDNPQFIRRVYLNVLGREPEPAGYNYWAHQMQSGMPRGVVMINFSDSNEFRSKTASGRPPGY